MIDMMECPMCCGEGVIDCNTCEGDGDSLCRCECGNRHLSTCDYCRGTGLESCGTCDGRGRCAKSDMQREREGQKSFLDEDDLPF